MKGTLFSMNVIFRGGGNLTLPVVLPKKTGFAFWWVTKNKNSPKIRKGVIYYLQQVSRTPGIFPKTAYPPNSKVGEVFKLRTCIFMKTWAVCAYS